VRALVPRKRNNWGDRDFIAVAPDGTVYLTWDYRPSAKKVTFICTKGGSCAFATGDLNVVLQKSTDGGRRSDPIIHVSPGFPASGGDSALWSSPAAGSAWNIRATTSKTARPTR
jgi:hypothetical protein